MSCSNDCLCMYRCRNKRGRALCLCVCVFKDEEKAFRQSAPFTSCWATSPNPLTTLSHCEADSPAHTHTHTHTHTHACMHAHTHARTHIVQYIQSKIFTCKLSAHRYTPLWCLANSAHAVLWVWNCVVTFVTSLSCVFLRLYPMNSLCKCCKI